MVSIQSITGGGALKKIREAEKLSDNLSERQDGFGGTLANAVFQAAKALAEDTDAPEVYPLHWSGNNKIPRCEVDTNKIVDIQGSMVVAGRYTCGHLTRKIIGECVSIMCYGGPQGDEHRMFVFVWPEQAHQVID